MKRIKIAITSVGSGIGQSVIDSLRTSDLPIYTIGIGGKPMAFGTYDCDVTEYVPFINAPNYFEEIYNVILRHQPDIVIPGQDLELLLFSQKKKLFEDHGIKVLIGDERMVSLCRDKVLMSKLLRPVSTSFINCYDLDSVDQLKQDLNAELVKFPLIAKPRDGYASTGLKVLRNDQDLCLIDQSHVVQPIVFPHTSDANYSSFCTALDKGVITQVSEVSVQYVFSRSGREIGRMASYNKLNAGVPIEIIPYHTNELWETLQPVVDHLVSLGLEGPINIQGRLTNEGYQFFEMNPRFTGITGLRAMMGFNEVEACVRDYMDMPVVAKLDYNKRKVGIRQTKNRVVDVNANEGLKNAVHQGVGYAWKNMKPVILVTGATGYIGSNLIEALAQNKDASKIIALTRNAQQGKEMFESLQDVETVAVDDIINGHFSLGNVDVVIHAASGRTEDGLKNVADGLAFTQFIIEHAVKHQVTGFINISSQAVYGLSQQPLWNESMPAIPETPYGQSKWSSELLTNMLHKLNQQTFSTSLRIARVFGACKNMRWDELPHLFTTKAIKGEPINIVGGNQHLDFVDVKDVISAIRKLLTVEYSVWSNCYNVSAGKPILLKDIAALINDVVRQEGYPGSEIQIQPKDVKMSFGMDLSKIKGELGWTPAFTFQSSIKEIIKTHKR